MNLLNEIQNQTPVITPQFLLELTALIDLTLLGNNDTSDDILNLISKANQGISDVKPAGVCIYSNYCHLVKKEINPTIKTVAVGGCFPTGQTLLSAKIEEIKAILNTGVDEIDIVMNRSSFFNGDYISIGKEISKIKGLMGSLPLKVILETGDLKTQKNIELASTIAIESGADFIKTSTGKTTYGASLEAVYTMCNTIKTHYDLTGNKIGIKPSGGIRTIKNAYTYYKVVENVLGKEWLNKDLFRIGASSLFDNILNELNKS